jgi:hypothetical protein
MLIAGAIAAYPASLGSRVVSAVMHGQHPAGVGGIADRPVKVEHSVERSAFPNPGVVATT